MIATGQKQKYQKNFDALAGQYPGNQMSGG
jgi:hypothetical protein